MISGVAAQMPGQYQVVFTGEIPGLWFIIRKIVNISTLRTVRRCSKEGRMLWRLGIGLVGGVGHREMTPSGKLNI
jgi:hypothetical protein